MKKKAQRPAKPKVNRTATLKVKPVDAKEIERLRLIQEALEQTADEDRRQLAAKIAADLEAARPQSAWARILKWIRESV